MFKNMKLSAKIIGGFFIMLIIAASIGGFGYLGLRNVNHTTHGTIIANHLQENLLQMRRSEKDFMLRGDEKYIKRVAELSNKSEELTDNLKAMLYEKDQAKIDEIKNFGAAYHAAFKEYAGTEKARVTALKAVSNAAHKVMDASNKAWMIQKKKLQENIEQDVAKDKLKDRVWKVDATNELNKLILLCRRSEKDFVIRKNNKYTDKVMILIDQLITLAKEVKSTHSKGGDRERMDVVIVSTEAYRKAFLDYVKFYNGGEKAKEKMGKASKVFMGDVSKILEEYEAARVSEIKKADVLIISFVIGGIIIGLILAFYITRSITKPINRIIEGLNEGANQVASASGQVSA